MRDNDIVFMNLHRRYLDSSASYGGFLGIYLLAAFVRSNGYDGQAYAGTLHQGWKLLDLLCQQKKIRMVGLYCDYENMTENCKLSRYIWETYHIPVLLGGPQATSFTKEYIQKTECQAVVSYEGELTVLELMDYFLDGTGALEDILGIAYLRDGKLIHNEERPVIENLDALPIISDDCYLLPRKEWQELSIMTGRGCPFHCAFCHEGHHTRKVRFRSVPHVMAEIDAFLQRQKPGDNCYILFTDDTFTLEPARIHEFCQQLEERRKKYKFQWFCEGHIHTLKLHPEMIADIAAAGCQRIQLGIEAGTLPVLQAYRKNTTPEEIKEVVAACRDAGIQQIYGNIILGSALFSRDVFEQDLAFGKDLLELGQGTVELGVVSYWPLAETSITDHPDAYQLNIVDQGFDTSLDDFPQTETADIDRWKIVQMMQLMQQEFTEMRQEMLLSGRVPMKRILSWLPKENRFKAYGMWWQTLRSLPNLYAYVHMLSLDEGLSFSEAAALGDCVQPMRTLSVNEYLVMGEDGQAKIGEIEVSHLELAVFVLSTGRHTVSWVVARVLEENKEVTELQIREAIYSLEKKYLIVYVKE